MTLMVITGTVTEPCCGVQPTAHQAYQSMYITVDFWGESSKYNWCSELEQVRALSYPFHADRPRYNNGSCWWATAPLVTATSTLSELRRQDPDDLQVSRTVYNESAIILTPGLIIKMPKLVCRDVIVLLTIGCDTRIGHTGKAC
jgi:hypothetical protein